MPTPVDNLMVIRHHHVLCIVLALRLSYPGMLLSHRRPSCIGTSRVPPHTGCRVWLTHLVSRDPPNRRARLNGTRNLRHVASPWSNLWILGTAIFAAVWALAITAALTAAVTRCPT